MIKIIRTLICYVFTCVIIIIIIIIIIVCYCKTIPYVIIPHVYTTSRQTDTNYIYILFLLIFSYSFVNNVTLSLCNIYGCQISGDTLVAYAKVCDLDTVVIEQYFVYLSSKRIYFCISVFTYHWGSYYSCVMCGNLSELALKTYGDFSLLVHVHSHQF